MSSSFFQLLMSQANRRLAMFSLSRFGIDLVNGSAKIDGLSEDLSSYLNKYVVITDTAGKSIRGFLKAQGTGGGTFGADMVTNGTMEATHESGGIWYTDDWSDGDYESFTRSSDPYAGTYAGLCDMKDPGGTPSIADVFIAQDIYPGSDYTGKMLYITAMVKKITTLSTPAIGLTPADIADVKYAASVVDPATYTALAGYITVFDAASTLLLVCRDINGVSNARSVWDNVTCRLVTAPSSSGYTITNSSGGTTYNWLSKDTGFNPNDSTFTVTIFAV